MGDVDVCLSVREDVRATIDDEDEDEDGDDGEKRVRPGTSRSGDVERAVERSGACFW